MKLAAFKRLCAAERKVKIIRHTGDKATVTRTIKRVSSTDLIFFPWRKAADWELNQNGSVVVGTVFSERDAQGNRTPIATITLNLK